MRVTEPILPIKLIILISCNLCIYNYTNVCGLRAIDYHVFEMEGLQVRGERITHSRP